MNKWTKDNEGWVIEADRWENQDLVLAAPDLLEALQEARAEVAYIASGMSHSLFKTNAAKCCLARIDKAIEKAIHGEPNDHI